MLIQQMQAWRDHEEIQERGISSTNNRNNNHCSNTSNTSGTNNNMIVIVVVLELSGAPETVIRCGGTSTTSSRSSPGSKV